MMTPTQTPDGFAPGLGGSLAFAGVTWMVAVGEALDAAYVAGALAREAVDAASGVALAGGGWVAPRWTSRVCPS